MNFRQLVKGFKKLELDSSRPVLVHASFSSFSDLKGGPEQLVGAMLESFKSVLAPTFTYKTMITPETGPPNNAIEYGSNLDLNKIAEIFYLSSIFYTGPVIKMKRDIKGVGIGKKR